MDPKYRFTIVISFLLMVWWTYIIITTYLFGARGLNIERYQEGILWVAATSLAGFALVWAASRVVLWQQNRKTGFEASVTDEFKTKFEMKAPDGSSHPFKISLSKFLPQLVAVPDWHDVSPLEAELIGFLNAYRHWPVNLDEAGNSRDKMTSLYEKSFARWQIMRHLPGSGPWHRVIALAKDLALVQAYKEVRTPHSLYQFWTRDSVVFKKRCRPHGGIAAFVLSTMPAFRSMVSSPEGLRIQKTLLTALRYHEDPSLLPSNSPPLARELVDYLWRSESQLRQLNVGDLEEMTPERFSLLRETLSKQWFSILSQIKTAAEDGTPAVFLQPDGSLWVHANAIIQQVAYSLPSELRQTMQLWGSSPENDAALPGWIHLYPALKELEFIAASHNGMQATNGYFSLQVGDKTFKHMLKLDLSDDNKKSILKNWADLKHSSDFIDVVADTDQIVTTTTLKATSLDSKISALL